MSVATSAERPASTAVGPRRVSVLGVPVDAVDMATALRWVEARVRDGVAPATILAVNPEKVYQVRGDPFLARFFAGGGLLLPDGIGVVMAMNVLHRTGTPRVPGADLMLAVCERAAAAGHRVFLYGAREDVNRRSAELLAARYPGLRIVGRANGYLSAAEIDALVARINASGADILFVALGSPRQERWMDEHLPHLRVKVCQGIGGTLDTITGDVKRAPPLFRRLGLEWLYRLIRQPSRWRRQIVYPVFVLAVTRERLSMTLRSLLGRARSVRGRRP